MENVSKALIMAGGVLIALLILAALTYMWTSSSQLFIQEERTQLAEQIKDNRSNYDVNEISWILTVMYLDSIRELFIIR